MTLVKFFSWELNSKLLEMWYLATQQAWHNARPASFALHKNPEIRFRLSQNRSRQQSTSQHSTTDPYTIPHTSAIS